ncbi:MAG: universal stress protein [Betaproteobacteria bacterium]|nr:universal stress protein [Betaproteobacteria bacterium]
MKKLLLPVDDSQGARASVQTCIRLFGSRPAVSVLLLGKMQELEQAALNIFDTHRKLLRENHLSRIKTLTRFGHVADEIIKAAAEQETDLIILGSSRTLLQKLLMGDVVREVAANAKVPVLIAR